MTNRKFVAVFIDYDDVATHLVLGPFDTEQEANDGAQYVIDSLAEYNAPITDTALYEYSVLPIVTPVEYVTEELVEGELV